MISKEDRKVILYLMGENALKGSDSLKFSYIANPDKTIRWIFPKSLNHPMFLVFYSTSSIRAKILSFFIYLAYLIRQPKLVNSGDFSANITRDSRLNNILCKYNYSGFSLFTGTIGENRKAVLEIHKQKKILAFVKIALGEKSKSLVKNEIHLLSNLSSYRFNKLVVPCLLDSTVEGTVELSNIKPKKFKQFSKVTKLHLNVLGDIYDKSHVTKEFMKLACFNACRKNIVSLELNYKKVNGLDKSRIQCLIGKITQLYELVSENYHFPSSIVHGDFTPWNMYSSKDKLYVFDWELGGREFPLFYDLIHFIFQSETLIHHSGYLKINLELRRVLKMKVTKEIIEKYGIDFNKHYMFYLIYTVSYYLNIYARQERLHEQVYWLMSNWENAADSLIAKNGVVFN